MKFIVLGNPKGKQRPKVTVKNGFGRAYTPQETVIYENLIRIHYENEAKANGIDYDTDAPIRLIVRCMCPIPKSFSQKKKKQAIDGDILPMVKPDHDNVLKVVGDALNEIAYKDDSQVCVSFVEKKYSETPCLIVEIGNV